MKQYPSIERCTGQSYRKFDAYVFDKLDGSNLRFEWSRKRGWYKSGTKKRMFDESDMIFGEAITVFHGNVAPLLDRVVAKNRWQNVVAFLEFWGKYSFAGYHRKNDRKMLSLIDVAVDKKGIMSPKDFVKYFDGKVETAKFLGRHRWNKEFIERVRVGDLPGVTFEGVVGKAGDKHDLIMSKAKSQAWIDKVFERYGRDEGEKLL